MAVSGAGGWTPSRSVTIRNGALCVGSIWQNKPRDIVVGDMSLAADLLRRNPAAIIEIDTRGDNIPRLAQYLKTSGDLT